MQGAIQLGNTPTGALLPGTPASATIALPTLQNGDIPKYVRIACSGGLVSVMLADDTGGTPTTRGGQTTITVFQGAFISPEAPVVLTCRGNSHLMYIGISGNEALSIAPLEG